MPAPDPIGEGPLAARPLAGRRIAVLEHRELDRLGGMIEAQGALTLRCPLVGNRRRARSGAGAGLAHPLCRRPAGRSRSDDRRGVAALARVCRPGRAGRGVSRRARPGPTITRGPKPAQALREIGLTPGLRAERPTSEGVVAALAQGELRGRRVALQLYPGAPATLVDFLKGAGARPDPVWPYAYLPAAGDAEVLRLIEEMAAGRVDAVAFTSAAQIVQLFELARGAEAEPQLRAALERTRIAAIGPVVAAELERRGLCALIMPRDTYFMKPLVSAIIAALPPRPTVG